jgi:hypothetical protein
MGLSFDWLFVRNLGERKGQQKETCSSQWCLHQMPKRWTDPDWFVTRDYSLSGNLFRHDLEGRRAEFSGNFFRPNAILEFNLSRLSDLFSKSWDHLLWSKKDFFQLFLPQINSPFSLRQHPLLEQKYNQYHSCSSRTATTERTGLANRKPAKSRLVRFGDSDDSRVGAADKQPFVN